MEVQNNIVIKVPQVICGSERSSGSHFTCFTHLLFQCEHQTSEYYDWMTKNMYDNYKDKLYHITLKLNKGATKEIYDNILSKLDAYGVLFDYCYELDKFRKLHVHFIFAQTKFVKYKVLFKGFGFKYKGITHSMNDIKRVRHYIHTCSCSKDGQHKLFCSE